MLGAPSNVSRRQIAALLRRADSQIFLSSGSVDKRKQSEAELRQAQAKLEFGKTLVE